MRAVVVEEPEKLVVKEIKKPKIAEDEALVKVVTSSICNATDNHILHGTFEGYHDFYPQILGHEVYGKVVEVGKRVDGVSVGERVVYYASRGGAFCEYSLLNPKEDVFARVPQSISDREASLCEMFNGSYMSLVYPAQIKPTEDVLVIGQGPMGLIAMQLAKLKAKSVSAVDMYPFRLNKSLELGADYTYNHSAFSIDEIVSHIQKNTGSMDLVLMCIDADKSKDLDAFDLGLEALRMNGRMAALFTGVKNLNHRISLSKMIQKNIRFQRRLEDVYSEGGKTMSEVFQEGVDLVAAGLVKLESLITHEVNFEGVKEALDLCENKKNEVLKVIVRPE